MEAAACPSCPAADEVWGLVWSDGFWTHLAGALLPFVVIVGVALVVERALRDARGT